MNRQFAFARSGGKPQQGAGTLVVVLILLLLSTLVVFFTARTAVNEQRLSANEIRSKQAFDAASAGQDVGLAYFSRGSNPLDTTLSTPTLYSSGRPVYYQVTFCSPTTYATADLPACPSAHTGTLTCTHPTTSEGRTPIVVSCGWSDDDQAIVRQVQKASGTPSLAGDITAPVVSRGATNMLTGGASIFNYFNDLTIWSGGNVPIQSATGKSFIRDVSTDSTATSSDYRNTGNSPSCNNPPAHYTCSSQGGTINSLGPDVIPQDSFLSSMSAAEFFANFMGRTPNTYRDTVATYRVDLDGTITGEDSNSVASLTGLTDEVIWVEGDVSGLGDVGTLTHPVILVINGNLDLSANTNINGLVYVTGTVSGNGSPTIYGALISAGNVNTNGNLKVIFDPNVLGQLPHMGQPAYVPGTWRDW